MFQPARVVRKPQALQPDSPFFSVNLQCESKLQPRGGGSGDCPRKSAAR